MSRIEEITERRLKLWRQQWDEYERDFEARIARYTQILAEEFHERRKEDAQLRGAGRSEPRIEMRRL